jgi:sulfite exporter TauE/SafE
MTPGFLASMLALGLASGVHCVGMCGGFVAAFAAPARVIPIAAEKRLARLLLFNAGRITTYAALGALSGFLGGRLAFALGAQTALYVLANVMLVAIGLHLAGATQFLGFLERFTQPLWRRVAPMIRLRSAYLPGLAWGFVPCGLVYGALAAAAFAGSAAGGAAAMAAYGLGTLPWLMAMGTVFQLARKPFVRTAIGATVLGFGVFGLAHAGVGADALRGLLCL